MTDNHSLIINFLEELRIDSSLVTINESGETIEVTVDMPSDQRGIYIGHHASTLDSLQLILSLMVNNQRDEHLRILLDIGDYRKRRLEKISEIVERVKDEVRSSSLPVSIPHLSPTERRQVHVMLSEDAEFTTYSEGFGMDRQLIIALSNS